MPSGFNSHTSDLETVIGVQFSILSPDEIEKRAVVEVTSQATYEGNEPKVGGLFDPRMGVLENGKICRSCGQTNHGCPGHFGHYRVSPSYGTEDNVLGLGKRNSLSARDQRNFVNA